MNACRNCGKWVMGYPFCSAACANASSARRPIDSPRLQRAWLLAREAQKQLDADKVETKAVGEKCPGVRALRRKESSDGR